MGIGFVGSVFVILLVKACYQRIPDRLKRAAAYVGMNSLGIYILSDVLFGYVVPKVTQRFTGLNYAIAIVETVMIVLICLLGTAGIKRVKTFNVLLLGGRA